jgi:acyl-CoA synthetase (AMP-forming)/AMP-acid ligase II
MDERVATLIGVLRHHAALRPQSRAYVFVADRGGEEASLTFAELDRRARALAGHLALRGRPGERALLLFPPGLDFLVGFFGCLYAGIIAVPMMPPRRHRLRESSLSIIADCAPTFGLTVEKFREPMRQMLDGLSSGGDMAWIAVDAILSAPDGGETAAAEPSPDAIAFLQYTSGSTSSPKGVMVSHRNLLENLEMIRRAYDYGCHSTHVSWVPLYHDMGLILNALEACYVGALCVLMAPVAFMQRPLSWLKAIHDYRAAVAGGPNFAFDLCVERCQREPLSDIDLSSWRVAVNGAEPVRAETLERFAGTFARHGFRADTLQPSYGMAEATLLISGGKRDAPVVWSVSRDALQRNRALPVRPGEIAQRLAGCGKALVGERIAIVDPVTLHRLPAGEVGEIWAQGPHVAQGYWCQPEATRQTFRAHISGDEGWWLRTGDLGCLDETGELYITGRIKDMMIVRGANYYPQDIERVAERSHPALRPHCGAVFAASRDGRELLVVVQEIERTYRQRANIDEIVGAIRQAVVQEHELTIHEVVLIRTGTIPKTTSGKIRRGLTRELWLKDELEIWDGATTSPTPGSSADDSAAAGAGLR